jgi:hypothetical protein
MAFISDRAWGAQHADRLTEAARLLCQVADIKTGSPAVLFVNVCCPKSSIVPSLELNEYLKNVASILCVSPDPVLLQTRHWILEAYFNVDAANRLSDVAAVVQSKKYDLVVLCYA